MKRWYVIQVFAGYEEAVKKDLEKNIKEQGLDEFFGEVLMPSAKVKSFFEAEEKENRQLFPGYMLVQMELMPKTQRLVLTSPRVIKFLGGKNPTPLSKSEVEHVMGQITGKVAVTPEKSGFIVGSEVDIKEGPFAGFVGIIEDVDEENEKLTVMVSIFGRLTPVKLSFDQVRR